MMSLLLQVGLVIAGAALTLHMAIDTVKTARDIHKSWQIVRVEKKAEKPEVRPRGKHKNVPPRESRNQAHRRYMPPRDFASLGGAWQPSYRLGSDIVANGVPSG
jgi:hypothetical protein